MDLSGNMSNPESHTLISHNNEQREKTDTSSDVRRHPETKGLHFNSLEDVFSYLNNVDEQTWEQMLVLISSKVHHLKALLESQPGSTIQQTGNSRTLTENWYRFNNVTLSRFGSKKIVTIVALFFFVLCVVFGTLFLVYLNKTGDCVPLPHSPPPCPPHWFWYDRKCYYFSEGEKNWNSSQDFCSSHDASLTTITDEEKELIHLLKGRDNFWIGLRRSPGQPWKWANGDNATLEVFGEGGDCAFYDNESRAMSSRCKTTFRWMCSKPDASEKPAE